MKKYLDGKIIRMPKKLCNIIIKINDVSADYPVNLRTLIMRIRNALIELKLETISFNELYLANKLIFSKELTSSKINQNIYLKDFISIISQRSKVEAMFFIKRILIRRLIKTQIFSKFAAAKNFRHNLLQNSLMQQFEIESCIRHTIFSVTFPYRENLPEKLEFKQLGKVSFIQIKSMKAKINNSWHSFVKLHIHRNKEIFINHDSELWIRNIPVSNLNSMVPTKVAKKLFIGENHVPHVRSILQETGQGKKENDTLLQVFDPIPESQTTKSDRNLYKHSENVSYSSIRARKNEKMREKMGFFANSRYPPLQEAHVQNGQARKATKQMIKNRGLTRHRKSANKNPRVKNRKRYSKIKNSMDLN
jgi:hypothetical protein